jgi:hypothetical protein
MRLFPIEVVGTKITVPDLSLQEGHAFLRRAILDGELPLTMPIGFVLNSPKNSAFASVIDRNRCCQESMLSVATNIGNIILVGDMGDEVDCDEQEGAITTGSMKWRSKGKYECHPIGQDKYLFTATDKMSIRFFVRKATGYQSMAKNAAILSGRNYFPLNVMYTLIDYVRVLPLIGKNIEVQYLNGMTPELFERVWEEAK